MIIQKEQTLVIKGIAILLMLFYHLFNQMQNVDLCETYIYIGQLPLLHILTRATNPVPFFLILGGYGMYTVYKIGDKHRFTRVLKLYIHYLVISAFFLLVACIFIGRATPSVTDIFSNITGFYTTWNGEVWFLFPYAILSLTSAWLFRLTDKYRTRYVLLSLFFINLCTSFAISRYGEAFFYHNYYAYNPLLYFHLMFPFYLGAMWARHGLPNVFLKEHSLPPLSYTILLLVLIIARFCFSTGAWHPLYVFAFIYLFLNIKMPPLITDILKHIGCHSMNIWMIHSWICYYLWHDWIYSLKYPAVIYFTLLFLSYIVSVIVNAICKPIEKRIIR